MRQGGCNRHSLPAVLTYVSISFRSQCNCMHSYIAPDASGSTASSGATLINDNRRFHAAQPPLLAWPALLSLSMYPDSARRSVPACSPLVSWHRSLTGPIPVASALGSRLGMPRGSAAWLRSGAHVNAVPAGTGTCRRASRPGAGESQLPRRRPPSSSFAYNRTQMLAQQAVLASCPGLRAGQAPHGPPHHS